MNLKLTVAAILTLAIPLQGQTTKAAGASDWPTYGGDPGGQRYASSDQIKPNNVRQLQVAWSFRTGIMKLPANLRKGAEFEATPIIFHGLLYFSSPTDEIFALDPETGVERWHFDPHMNQGAAASRGVAAWDGGQRTGPCASRIFVGTMDARLLAVDAVTGLPCSDFGKGGTVDLLHGVHQDHGDDYFITSPPAVIGNLVVVGSGIGDGWRVDTNSGVVRAFDCVTGKLVWAWDPIPWAQLQKLRTGAANAWGVIATDPVNHLVFVPTGSASPDFYGGTRPGDNRDANSVVALDATTGRRVWGFQVVHHDVWDYDVAAEPLLFTFHGNIPAIAISTKQGLLFVLNRLTGEPLYPIEERAVPKSNVPGEQLSPTQPFSTLPSLVPLTIPTDVRLGYTDNDNHDCRALISSLRYDGIYSAPSFIGTLNYPGNLGGVNWGSSAIDPSTGILYANTNRHAFAVKLIPRDPSNLPLRSKLEIKWSEPKFHLRVIGLFAAITVLFAASIVRRKFSPGWPAFAIALLLFCGLYIRARSHTSVDDVFTIRARSAYHFGREQSPQLGTPYSVIRQAVIAPKSQEPCTPLPWGTVSAINLNTGQAVWHTPLGSMHKGEHTGTLNLGGDIVTASGLLFTAASEEPYLRAFSSATGDELWDGPLPAPAQATPMSYTANGRQYIVIAAGGHGGFGTPLSDTLVAFALPKRP